MTTRVEVEEIETTTSEKLLAAVLTAFLLIGLLWVYFHIDVERDDAYRYSGGSALSAPDRAAIDRRDAADDELERAREAQSARGRTLVDRREAYRTALDEGRRDAALAQRYRAAQSAYDRAQRRRRAAALTLVAARPAARAAELRVAAAEQRRQARVDAQQRHDDRVSFARRLGFVLAWLGASYALLAQLRRRRSRWLIAGMAAIALLALVMAIDYLSDYVEIADLGLLVLSAAGALMTIGAFAVLQRYLARRLPERRVRKRECPFCGYPTGAGPHCEGCGRDVVGECSTCHAARRVGTRRCAACGAA